MMLPATRKGNDDLRIVTMTVHGDLLVHGHKLPKDDAIEASFRYPAGAPPSSMPTRRCAKPSWLR